MLEFLARVPDDVWLAIAGSTVAVFILAYFAGRFLAK